MNFYEIFESYVNLVPMQLYFFYETWENVERQGGRVRRQDEIQVHACRVVKIIIVVRYFDV